MQKRHNENEDTKLKEEEKKHEKNGLYRIKDIKLFFLGLFLCHCYCGHHYMRRSLIGCYLFISHYFHCIVFGYISSEMREDFKLIFHA